MSGLKVYLAAPYSARDHIRRAVLPEVERVGLVSTSGWLNGTQAIGEDTVGAAWSSTEAEVAKHSTGDLDGVRDADAVLFFTAQWLIDELDVDDYRLHTGGRHTELGYALANDVPVYVIGEPENIFQRSLCDVYTNLDVALRALVRYPFIQVTHPLPGL